MCAGGMSRLCLNQDHLRCLHAVSPPPREKADDAALGFARIFCVVLENVRDVAWDVSAAKPSKAGPAFDASPSFSA